MPVLMQSFALRYPEVEALLAELHQVAPTGRVALMGRIKNLQRKGWPPGTNSGRGKPADYDMRAVIELLMAFELTALRIPPEQAVEVLRELGWHYSAAELARIGKDLRDGKVESVERVMKLLNVAVLMIFDPDGLETLREGSAQDPLGSPHPPWFLLEGEGELPDLLYSGRRFAAVNVTRLLINAAIELERIAGINRRRFGEALLDWLGSLVDVGRP